MKEMTPAERVTLNALRATALAKMSDADFANLETEVANKGLRNLDGWFGAQVAKAVEQVLKHPGHANQASHGGKGGASTPAGKTPAGKKQQASRANDVAQQAVDNANLNVPATAPKAARFRANEARASHAKARQTDDPQQKAYHLKAASEHAKRASQLMEDENFHDAAEAWGNASKALATASAFNGSVGKSVEPVEKHPGHANQASHGGGKGGGGGGSSSAPASSGGSGGGGSFKPAQSEALIKDADDGLKEATLTSRSIRNQHDLQLSGGTRDRVLVKHDEAASSLRAAKRNVDLAAKLNGSDRGSVQVNMRAARSHAQKAKGHMAEAYKIAGLDPSKSQSFKRFDDSIAKIEGAVMEGTDGGVF